VQDTPEVLAWGTIVGAVLPYLIALVQQPRWSGTVKRVVALVAAVVFGIGTAVVNGQLDNVAPTRESLLTAVAAVFVASQAVYARFAWPTTARLEAATSPDHGR
jgi:hypothetical protein